MKVFVSGGCKNGKSTFAEQFAKSQSQRGKLYYVATMVPFDEEDQQRILTHQRARRDMGFETIEQPKNIAELLTKCDPSGSFLVDSVTALLMNELYLPDYTIDVEALPRLQKGLWTILDALPNVVFVSDYIYGGGNVGYSPSTLTFMQHLSALDHLLVKRCECVVEVAYTHRIIHKGAMPNEIS